MPELNGTGKQTCSKCNYKSLPGLKKGDGRCPYHYTAYLWGYDWANETYPNFNPDYQQPEKPK